MAASEDLDGPAPARPSPPAPASARAAAPGADLGATPRAPEPLPVLPLPPAGASPVPYFLAAFGGGFGALLAFYLGVVGRPGDPSLAPDGAGAFPAAVTPSAQPAPGPAPDEPPSPAPTRSPATGYSEAYGDRILGSDPGALDPVALERFAAGLLPPPSTGVTRIPAMAALGDGTVLYADGSGRLFHLRSEAAGLSLSAVYALREDRTRHGTEADVRAPHGVYLDDLALEGRRGLERARQAFWTEVRSGAVDRDANARLEARARAILAWGDATFLLERLADKRYGVRRAAALTLGGAGFPEARPALEEVLEESPARTDGAKRARALLDQLGTGGAGK